MNTCHSAVLLLFLVVHINTPVYYVLNCFQFCIDQLTKSVVYTNSAACIHVQPINVHLTCLCAVQNHTHVVITKLPAHTCVCIFIAILNSVITHQPFRSVVNQRPCKYTCTCMYTQHACMHKLMAIMCTHMQTDKCKTYTQNC